MFKKRYFSAHSDFKTGFFCKFFFIIGGALLIIYLILKIIAFIAGQGSSGIVQQINDFSQTTAPDSILAFAIIFLAVGFILFFFHYQFGKLAKIADEIEKGEDIKNQPDK